MAIFCYQVNGGTCKNKVSERNNYLCAAGHFPSKGIATKTSSIDGALSLDIRSMDSASRRKLASTVGQDEETQMQLIKYGSHAVREKLASNPSVTKNAQLLLLELDNGYLSYLLSKNPAIDETVQTQIYKKEAMVGGIIESNLAQNPNLSRDLAIKIFTTGSYDSALSITKSSSLAEIHKLALEDPSLANALSFNESIGRDIAAQLAEVKVVPYGFARDKPVQDLISDRENIALLNSYPYELGIAYLDRLINYPKPADSKEANASATKLAIGYALTKVGECRDKSKRHYETFAKYKILVTELYPDDEEFELLIS